MASAPTREWRVQSYTEQRETVWPKEGQHILAQYDDDSVVVYQAYRPEIADYAVIHLKYVCWPGLSGCSFKVHNPTLFSLHAHEV